jgi:hypothetical protein
VHFCPIQRALHPANLIMNAGLNLGVNDGNLVTDSNHNSASIAVRADDGELR